MFIIHRVSISVKNGVKKTIPINNIEVASKEGLATWRESYKKDYCKLNAVEPKEVEVFIDFTEKT